MTNLKRKLTLAVVFVIVSLLFFIISSEDMFSYVVVTDLPALHNNRLLVLYLIASVLLFVSKIAIGLLMLNVYNKLKSRSIPFLGYMWIVAVWLLMMGLVFGMNIVSIFRAYIWIDVFIRMSAGIFGIVTAYIFLVGYKSVIEMKTPEEYGRLADELKALRQENQSLQRILDNNKGK